MHLVLSSCNCSRWRRTAPSLSHCRVNLGYHSSVLKVRLHPRYWKFCCSDLINIPLCFESSWGRSYSFHVGYTGHPPPAPTPHFRGAIFQRTTSTGQLSILPGQFRSRTSPTRSNLGIKGCCPRRTSLGLGFAWMGIVRRGGPMGNVV